MSALSAEKVEGGLSEKPPRRAKHASQDTSKLVASGPTQTCWRSITCPGPASSQRGRELELALATCTGPRPTGPPDDQPVARAAASKPDVGLERERTAHACLAHELEEGDASDPAALETRLAEARELSRAGRDRDDRLARHMRRGRHAAALASCCGARSANFAKRLRNASFSVPTGPLRCLARMISARP
jgi:hypothetical protein